MARPKRIPSLTIHKARMLAVVRIDGKDYYCGPARSEEAQEKYERLIATWLSNGRRMPKTEEESLLLGQVIVRFMEHAKTYYPARGKISSEYTNFRDALRPLTRLYKRLPIEDFSIDELRIVRDHMIRQGLSRGVINQRVGKIRRVFRWAATMGLCSPTIYHALCTLDPLKRGRTTAPESKGIRPVPEEFIEAIREHMPLRTKYQSRGAHHPVWAMIQMQLLTGMRPGEVVIMRGCDLDMSPRRDFWRYSPRYHKLEHHGRPRTIVLSRSAQTIIEPLLTPDLEAPLFPNRSGREYKRNGYYQAVNSSCKRAGIPPWCPLQLRHNFGTSVREQLGLEASRVALGHTKIETSQIYAEVTDQQAERIARLLG